MGCLYKHCSASFLASLGDVNGLQMARCYTIQNTESARGVFREFMEDYIKTEGNKKMNIIVKREVQVNLSNFSLSKRESLLEEYA